jgi:hypothetical protein
MVNPQISLVFQPANCKSANFSPLDRQDEATVLNVKSLLDNVMAKTTYIPACSVNFIYYKYELEHSKPMHLCREKIMLLRICRSFKSAKKGDCIMHIANSYVATFAEGL